MEFRIQEKIDLIAHLTSRLALILIPHAKKILLLALGNVCLILLAVMALRKWARNVTGELVAQIASAILVMIAPVALPAPNAVMA